MKIIKKYFNKKKERGIALLFVIMLSSILLVVALSISEIAVKEAVFSTSARNANNAFYAADTGVECALFNDKSSSYVFELPIGSGTCLGQPLTISGDGNVNNPWTFQISGLGSSQTSCAYVEVSKIKESGETSIKTTTTIISRGYSKDCSATTGNVERELQVTYDTTAPVEVGL